LAGCIESVRVVAFPELLSEAVHLLVLKEFPVVVLHDTRGGDLYAAAYDFEPS
jgi:tartrate dehydratase beta subunit/fumarate hydratase class I family protein